MHRPDSAATAAMSARRRESSLKRLLAELGFGGLGRAYAHARETYPDECCGFILSSGVRRCENVQDDLHRADPATFPTTARRGFTLSAEDQLFLMDSVRGPDPVLAIYHSHTDADAYFSKADRAGLMHEGRLAYPELFHLVIACQAEAIAGAKLYGYDGSDFPRVASFEGAAM